MADTFSVSAALTPSNPTTGQTVTVTISGGDVLTTTSAGTITVTLHLTAADGATEDLTVSAPYTKVTTTPESVKITGISDPQRTWTVAADGLTATAVA